MFTDWKNVVVFCVSAVVLGSLVYTNHVPPAFLSALAGWLVQSPFTARFGAATSSTTTTTIAAPEVKS